MIYIDIFTLIEEHITSRDIFTLIANWVEIEIENALYNKKWIGLSFITFLFHFCKYIVAAYKQTINNNQNS